MYVATDFLTLHCNKFFGNKIDEITSNPKKLRRMVLSIVCIALLLDNMLYMVIVPIIPFYVQNMYHQNNIAEKEKAQQNYTISLYNMSSTNHTFNINKTNTKYHPLIPYKQHQDSSIGLLFASKAFIQLAMNPVSGTVIDRVGYDYPLLFGLIIIFFSTSVCFW
ncbi:hypothetical protein A3Q56_08704 [Intoshia linei]|uniref:Major facilitator superfamily (MFS) profile domain-containing protein n=1 Tax=Intoshia linei TaxID=1819745 RepID=A0A177ANI0_9BILA|nr:hypothetical protein A3Q56_08704 [Intoshia linei]